MSLWQEIYRAANNQAVRNFLLFFWKKVYIKMFEELQNSLIITQPTNALIVCNLFLNHFFKTLSLLLHVSIAYRLSSSGSTYSS